MSNIALSRAQSKEHFTLRCMIYLVSYIVRQKPHAAQRHVHYTIVYIHYSYCLRCFRPPWPLEKPCLLQATPHEFTLTTVEI